MMGASWRQSLLAFWQATATNLCSLELIGPLLAPVRSLIIGTKNPSVLSLLAIPDKPSTGRQQAVKYLGWRLQAGRLQVTRIGALSLLFFHIRQ